MFFRTTGVSASAPAAAPSSATTFSSLADTSNESSFIKLDSSNNIPMNPPPTPNTPLSSRSATMVDATPRTALNFKTPSTRFVSKAPNNFSSPYSVKLSFWQQSTTSTPATSISSWSPSPANIKTIGPASTTTTNIFTRPNSPPTSTALIIHPFSSASASTAAGFSLLPEEEQRDILQCADYLLALAGCDSRDSAIPDEVAVPKSQKRKAAAEPTERTTKRTKRARVTRSRRSAEHEEKVDKEPVTAVLEVKLPVDESDYCLKAAGELLQEARNGYRLNLLEVGLRRCMMAELMREVRNDYTMKRLRRKIRREKRATRWEAVKGRVRWNGKIYDL